MKKSNNSSAKPLINFLLYALRGLFLWYSFLIIMGIYRFILFLIDGRVGFMSLPVNFKSTRIGDVIIENGSVNSWFSFSGRGAVLADGLPQSAFYISSAGVFLYDVLILLMIHLICRMLVDLKKGDFLLLKNAIRLKYISFFGIALFLIDKLFIIISSSYLNDKLEFPNVEFITMNWFVISNWKYIFLYLFLLIIAEVFRLGAKLKEENELTI